METKNFVSFEVTRNDNVYRLIIPAGAAYGELYDAIFEMLNSTITLAQEAAAKAAPEVQQAQQEITPEVL